MRKLHRVFLFVVGAITSTLEALGKCMHLSTDLLMPICILRRNKIFTKGPEVLGQKPKLLFHFCHTPSSDNNKGCFYDSDKNFRCQSYEVNRKFSTYKVLILAAVNTRRTMNFFLYNSMNFLFYNIIPFAVINEDNTT